MAGTLLGGLGHATLKFIVVVARLFLAFCVCPKFCDLAKQRRKNFLGVSEVGKNDFSVFFCRLYVFFLVLNIFFLLRSRDVSSKGDLWLIPLNLERGELRLREWRGYIRKYRRLLKQDEDWSESGEICHLLQDVLPAYWKKRVEDEEKKRAKKRMAVRIMSPEEQHMGIMVYFRRNLGAPERMIPSNNSVYVEVFGETAGGRLLRLHNVEWRHGEKMKLQMIPARMSLDSIIQYVSIEVKLNSKTTVTIMGTMIAAKIDIMERSKMIVLKVWKILGAKI